MVDAAHRINAKRTKNQRYDDADRPTGREDTKSVAEMIATIDRNVDTLRGVARECLRVAVEEDSELMRVAIHAFLKARYAETPFEFLLAVRRFESQNAEELLEVATDIVDLYCSPGSANEVTMPRECRDVILHKIVTGTDLDGNLFAEAAPAVSRDLVNDSICQFVMQNRL